MTLEDIRKILRGSHGFKIHMVSGRVIEVPHPDFVALTRSSSSLLLSGEKSLVEIVRLSQIESIEVHEEAANA